MRLTQRALTRFSPKDSGSLTQPAPARSWHPLRHAALPALEALILCSALMWSSQPTCAQPVANDQTLLLARFEHGVDAPYAVGTATGQSSAERVPARFGMGVELSGGKTLSYRGDDGNFHPDAGTIEFWIKPHWAGSDELKHSLFNCTFGSRGYININVLPNGPLGIAISSGDGDDWKWRRADADISDWRVDEWHHVACTWGDGRMAIFVDGRLGRRTVTDARMPDTFPETMTFLACDATLAAARVSKERMDESDVRTSMAEANGPPPYRLLANMVSRDDTNLIVGSRRLLGGIKVPLLIAGQPQPSAIALRPGQEITLSSLKPFDRFQGRVGIDQLSGGTGACTIQLWADDRQVYETGSLSHGMPPSEVEVRTEQAERITLKCVAAGDDTSNLLAVVIDGAFARQGHKVMVASHKKLTADRIDMYRRQLEANRYKFQPSGRDPFFVTSKFWEDSFDPSTAPAVKSINGSISGFAAPGEYEPVNFVVYATTDLHHLDVHVSELRGTTHVIPKDSCELRIVQRGLMRDLYTLPVERSTVVSRFLLPYQPLEMPAGSFREYHLTVHVPEDAPAGIYRGHLSVSAAGHRSLSLPLEFEVLPIKLLPLKQHAYGMYYRLPANDDDGRQLQAELSDMRRHGVTTLKAAVGIDWTKEEGVPVPSSERLSQFLDHLEQHTFSGPLPVDTGLDRLCKILGYDPVATTSTSKDSAKRDTFVELAGKSMAQLEAVQREHPTFELLATHMDEVFGRGRLDRFIQLTQQVRQQSSLRVYITIHHSPRAGVPDLTHRIDPFVDVRCYNGHSLDDWIRAGHTFQELSEELGDSGDEAWTYYNIRGSFFRPEWTRLVNGFYLWSTPLKLHVPWMYYATFGNPLDDTDGPETRGHDFAYAAPDPQDPTNLIPTRHWVAFREGIDDMRYLETLEQQIAAGANRTAAREAQAWLDQLRRSLEITPDQVGAIEKESPILILWSDRFRGADYRQFRRQAARHIERLQRGRP